MMIKIDKKDVFEEERQMWLIFFLATIVCKAATQQIIFFESTDAVAAHAFCRFPKYIWRRRNPNHFRLSA